MLYGRIAPGNPPYTNTSNATFDIRATDISSIASAVERKIEFLNKGTTTVFQTFKIRAACDNTTLDLETECQNHTFTGVLDIYDYTSGAIIVHWHVTRGVRDVGSPVLSASGCNVGNIHRCVADKIDDMNVVEYSLCLCEAPSCYGGLWAICTYDACVDNKIYW